MALLGNNGGRHVFLVPDSSSHSRSAESHDGGTALETPQTCPHLIHTPDLTSVFAYLSAHFILQTLTRFS